MPHLAIDLCLSVSVCGFPLHGYGFRLPSPANLPLHCPGGRLRLDYGLDATIRRKPVSSLALKCC